MVTEERDVMGRRDRTERVLDGEGFEKVWWQAEEGRRNKLAPKEEEELDTVDSTGASSMFDLCPTIP